MVLAGWPSTNFAADLRNLRGHGGHSAQRVAIAIPRYKYTFLAEFQITPGALTGNTSVTNLKNFINGKLYGQLKRIDYPRIQIKNEKVRGYNKYRVVSSHAEYTPFQIVFHDDAASMVAALWKEYWNFYHETGNIGNSTTQFASEGMKYSANEQLAGPNARNEQDKRQSLGMRMRPTNMRHFFETITIYDLGTEPDSINIYTYFRPVLNQIDHDTYDNEDRTGKMTLSWTLDFEGFYFSIGDNQRLAQSALINQLGLDQAGASPSVGHATMKPAGSGASVGSGASSQGGTSETAEGEPSDIVPSTPDPVQQNPNLIQAEQLPSLGDIPASSTTVTPFGGTPPGQPAQSQTIPYNPGQQFVLQNGQAVDVSTGQPVSPVPFTAPTFSPTVPGIVPARDVIPGRPTSTPNLASPTVVNPGVFDLTPSQMKEFLGNPDTGSATKNTLQGVDGNLLINNVA